MTRKTTQRAPKNDAKPLCFVVGPIGAAGSDIRKLADFLLGVAIHPVCGDEFGYDVKRADLDPRPGSIGAAVIDDVVGADLVIADLTGHNPNVFYELGLRHSAGGKVIPVSADERPLPFDNYDQRTIRYDMTDWAGIQRSNEALRTAINAVTDKDYRDSNPLTQARGLQALAESGDTRDQVIATLQEQISSQANQMKALSARLRAQEELALFKPRSGMLDYATSAGASTSAALGISPEYGTFTSGIMDAVRAERVTTPNGAALAGVLGSHSVTAAAASAMSAGTPLAVAKANAALGNRIDAGSAKKS